MFGSDRRDLAAVGGIILTAALLALLLYPEQPNLAGNAGYQGQAADYRTGGYDCQPATVDALSRRERTKRAISCKEAEEEHRLKTDDLIQQRRAAHAAEASAILTYQQTIIGALGLAFGFITMLAAIGAAIYARHAANETRRGADYAERGLKFVAEANSADIRPYLFIDKVTADEVEDQVVVTFWLRNYGRMPARSIVARAHCYISTYHEEIRPNVLKANKIPIPHCAPGQDRRVFSRVWISREERDLMDQGELELIIRVRYWYYGRSIRKFSERADYWTDGAGLHKGVFYVLDEERRKRAAVHRQLMEAQYTQEPEFEWQDQPTPPE
ncbi:hypothetical protein [Sphingobium baderi]|uniref:Uncharacterized protein n=1 Tax=Sphingobium baderi LL03 TaxID=1114964 RepID=T0I9G6_9SPHN|nr:hypothetical protein [Sphingobium baderi]EQB06244.1 hypothetical protein L485_01075 [Sphingobium baderi LL03]KMS62715.1 hypothetical protein V475_06550 [Sphingobium baderi LL03]